LADVDRVKKIRAIPVAHYGTTEIA
jgi:hypothetical protein